MTKTKRLAIITTHPIQYYAPIFQLLKKRNNIEIKVFYTWSQAKEKVIDHTFGKEIKWDLPLLEGYNYEFVHNISDNPGTHHRNGIICPDLNHKTESWHPDAVLIFGWVWKAHHRAMKYFKGKIPVLFRGDSTLLDEQPGIKKLLRRIYLTQVYKNIDKALYVGSNNKAYYLAHGVKEKQLFYAPHAVDNERFYDDPASNYEEQARIWRQQLDIKNNNIVILYAGKFEPRKDLLVFIDTFIKMNRKDLKLILLGNGPQEDIINNRIKNLDNIIRLPFQNQSMMPIVYRLADYYCLPSKSETWGLAVNEALACGTPVIVSNKVGCAADIIQEGVNGSIFESNNLEDLKQTITTLFQKRTVFTKQACQSSIKPFNFSHICDVIEKIVTDD